MGLIFNIDEIMQIAIRIEENGRDFYKRAAETTKESSAKSLFNELAKMEARHIQYFSEIKELLLSTLDAKDNYDPEQEGVLYLNAFARGHVFPVNSNPAKDLTGREKTREILKLAIGFEKDSIVFYLGLQKLVPENLGKGKVDSIIKEEMSHISILSATLNQLET